MNHFQVNISGLGSLPSQWGWGFICVPGPRGRDFLRGQVLPEGLVGWGGSVGVTDRPSPTLQSLTSDLGIDQSIVADFVPDVRDAWEEAVPDEPGVGGKGGQCEASGDILGQGGHIEA